MALGAGIGFAITRARERARLEQRGLISIDDLESEEFRKQEKFIQNSLTCTIEFTKGVIPPQNGKLSGVLVLEAKEDIEHAGIYILMKGLPISEKKQRAQQKKRGTKPLTEVKFMVMESALSPGVKNSVQFDGGSREMYPLEFEVPNDLPIPLLTSRGGLIYKVHVCISISSKKYVVVGETTLRWRGHKKLEKEEILKDIKIEQQVYSKRGLMGLGRRKSALMEWRVGKGGYLSGDIVQIELWGDCKEKDGMDVECTVELVQKVWYQVPSGIRGVQMWVKMMVNVLASGGSEDLIHMGNGRGESNDDGKILLWQGELKLPRRLTPSIRFDFNNSVSYIVRTGIGVAGETKEDWVTGQVPFLIGTSKEVEDDADGLDGESVEEDEECGEEGDEAELDPESPTLAFQTCKGLPTSASTDTALTACRSQSIGAIPRDSRFQRAGSVSSIQSLASNTMSMFRFPPSYSELSSRRPSSESLPPAYSELGITKE